jgi:hypothetical protein
MADSRATALREGSEAFASLGTEDDVRVSGGLISMSAPRRITGTGAVGGGGCWPLRVTVYACPMRDRSDAERAASPMAGGLRCCMYAFVCVACV